MFTFQKAKVENGKIVITDTKQVDQNQLTSECWFIQIEGLKACKCCEFRETADCGGKKIRKRLLSKQ